MKKMFFAAMVAAALPLVAQTAAPCDVHSITVTGSGSATVAPDRVTFTVGVFTNAPTVSEAYKTNNEKTRRVVKSLKDLGVTDTEIQTSNFEIQTAYDDYPQRKAHGYNVSNNVTVTRENPKMVSDLLNAAVEAGANEARGVSFFVADPKPTRERAIERAVNDARVQAEKLASATGATLGRVLQVTTTELPAALGYAKNAVAEAITVMAPAIESGVETITYSVTITYELK